ncbi:MAG: hypothetical protein J2P25_22940 [Nocardiopsaceae bacterium]|nr:hypothetical protein [Nocardiopsaceae bacterium]
MSESSSKTESPVSEAAPPRQSRAVSGRWFAWVRIAFGVVWAVDAFLKWQPAFANQFLGMVTDAKAGQPGPVKAWITAWVDILSTQPHACACLLAIAETALATALLLGAFTNAFCVLGSLLSLIIWSTAEGFGGPYQLGSSTDPGASIIYVLVFVSLLAGAAGGRLGLDAKIRPWLTRSRFSKLAWLSSPQPTAE